MLMNIVDLAQNPLPGATEGVVVVAKYSDATSTGRVLSEYDDNGQAELVVDAGYERIAIENPDTIFLQCDKAFQGGNIAMAKAGVSVLPTFHLFFKGNRVGRVEGPKYNELQGWLTRYGTTSLTGERGERPDFVNNRVDPWGERRPSDQTPGTTNSFVPGYDWGKEGGAFDAAGKKAEDKFKEIFGGEELDEDY